MEAQLPAPGWGFPNPATPLGSSAYYSLRFAPSALRDDLATLHAWHGLIRSIPEEVSDPAIGIAKLRWWQEELARIRRDSGTHPMSARLSAVIVRHRLPTPPFIEVIAHGESVLTGQNHTGFEALTEAAERDLGALFELVAHCYGQDATQSLTAARRLGAYCSLVYGLRDSGWRLRRGRLDFLPVERLPPGCIPDLEGLREALPGLLAETATEIAGYRETGTASATALPMTLRIRARILDRLLRELEASGFAVADQRIALTPIRKLWHAWRESRSRH